MSKPQNTKPSIDPRWREVRKEYMRRHRIWVMEELPTMSTDQWDQYTHWVDNFGRYERTKDNG